MKPLKVLKIAFVLLLAVSWNSLIAQNGAITGKVMSSEDNAPLPGVSVVVKGTTLGTVTDAQGNYKINASPDATLVFSFIGYESDEVTVGGKTVIDVNLVQDIASLKEIVVVGYGTQTKKAVTGSVASVGYQKFKDRSYTNITQSLAGELPGVNIAQSQGAPGVSPIIRIRGVSSITAGTNPLYVVDGMPMENFNLNNINPQDIESVEVLKDASSAAIYGSRGANGVILITTKLGKPGKTDITFGYEYGVQKAARLIDMMDAQQFIQYYKDAHNNAWVASGPGRSPTDPNSVRGTQYRIPQDFIDNPEQFGKGTDWQDVMFRTAPSSNFMITASGGSEKTRFLVSSTYLDQQAILDRNYYKRLTVRTNIQHDISKKFRIGGNIALTGIIDRTEGTAGKADVVSLGQTNTPIFPVTCVQNKC